MSDYSYRDQQCVQEDQTEQSRPPQEFEQLFGNQAAAEEMYCALEPEVSESEDWLSAVDEDWLRTVQESVPRGIEICERIAELPVAEQLGLKHRWIRTENMEVGMGPATGEVPGVDGDRGDLPFSPTAVTDHTGQAANPKSNCVPAEQWNADWANVDNDCLERNNQVGTPTGRWTPLFNDCHTYVDDAMNACDPDVQRAKAAEEAAEAERLEAWYENQRRQEQSHPGRY